MLDCSELTFDQMADIVRAILIECYKHPAARKYYCLDNFMHYANNLILDLEELQKELQNESTR